MRKKSKLKKSIAIVCLVVAVITVVGLLYSLFLPVSVEEANIKLENIMVNNRGKALYDEALTEKEWRSEYFYNKSLYGMNWDEYEKLYCDNSSFDAYSVSFEIVNDTDKAMGIFSVDGLESNHIIVEDYLDNEESVFINPGETYFVSVIVYIDRDEFPDADEEFVLSKIGRINYSPLRGTGNAQIFFGGDICGLFYKRFFTVTMN